MVLIVIVFGVAMMIFANVMRSSLSARQVNAQAVLSSVLVSLAQKKDIENTSFSVDSLHILQEVKPYEKAPGMMEVHLTASGNSGENIAEARMIMQSAR